MDDYFDLKELIIKFVNTTWIDYGLCTREGRTYCIFCGASWEHDEYACCCTRVGNWNPNE